MIGLLLTESLAGLLLLYVLLVVASAYPMPSGAVSPIAILIGSVPLACVAAGWLASHNLWKRGRTRLALVASVAPVAVILLLMRAM